MDGTAADANTTGPDDDDTPQYLLFEIDEPRPGDLARGWYYEMQRAWGRTPAEPVGPYESDRAAEAAAKDTGAIRRWA